MAEAKLQVSSRSGIRRGVAVVAVAAALAVLAGCSTQRASSSVYSYGQAQREQIVRYGTVQQLRPVTLQSDESTAVGTLAGGALGGVLGNTIGGGSGRTVATVGGAILGALAGSAVEKGVNTRNGVEITVKLDNGETRVIAQEDDIALRVGQRVQVISGAGPTRVAPM